MFIKSNCSTFTVRARSKVQELFEFYQDSRFENSNNNKIITVFFFSWILRTVLLPYDFVEEVHSCIGAELLNTGAQTFLMTWHSVIAHFNFGAQRAWCCSFFLCSAPHILYDGGRSRGDSWEPLCLSTAANKVTVAVNVGQETLNMPKNRDLGGNWDIDIAKVFFLFCNAWASYSNAY